MHTLINARFTGKDEYPVLNKQSEDLVVPFQLVRFTDRKIASLNDAICFYECDARFTNSLREKNIPRLIPSLSKAGAIIQPDYSILADEPLVLQKMAVFNKNRVAVELQSYGLDVIPNLRWGDKRSFEFAFKGIPKHQICAIGTYGQIKDKEKRLLFENGLEVALEKVRPKIVLIYGTMPNEIFAPYQNNIPFISYESWHTNFTKEAS